MGAEPLYPQWLLGQAASPPCKVFEPQNVHLGLKNLEILCELLFGLLIFFFNLGFLCIVLKNRCKEGVYNSNAECICQCSRHNMWAFFFFCKQPFTNLGYCIEGTLLASLALSEEAARKACLLRDASLPRALALGVTLRWAWSFQSSPRVDFCIRRVLVGHEDFQLFWLWFVWAVAVAPKSALANHRFL